LTRSSTTTAITANPATTETIAFDHDWPSFNRSSGDRPLAAAVDFIEYSPLVLPLDRQNSPLPEAAFDSAGAATVAQRATCRLSAPMITRSCRQRVLGRGFRMILREDDRQPVGNRFLVDKSI
jgi:hypothetical protein